MKAVHFIPPVVALGLVVAWNARQAARIDRAETDLQSLRTAVSASAPPAVAPARQSNATDGPLDLTAVAAAWVTGSGGGRADHRLMAGFLQRLAGMSEAEILAALDEIDALELSGDQRAALEELLVGRLVELAPVAALTRFAGRAGEEELGAPLARALRDWAVTDPAAAAEWLDARIARGDLMSRSLDERSELRTMYESALLGPLISTDPRSAAARLEALPEDQRREILEQLPFARLSPQEQLAYTEMVRTLVPADERPGSFANMASQLAADSGYGKVTDFLDSVRATPLERAAAARQTAEFRLETLAVAGQVTRTSVDELRTWLDRQAPDRRDAITGRALAEAAQAGGPFTYEQAVGLVLAYPGDDVLVAFLEGYAAHSDMERARALAARVADPARRAQILAELE